MADPIIISGIFKAAQTVISRIWPDPAQQAEASLKLAQLEQAGDFKFLDADVQLMQGQIETNKIEAQHGGLFKGGWRPFVGWTCGVAMAYKFIIYPFLVFIVQVIAHFMPETKAIPIEILPVIDWAELSVILIGMLGLGTMRSYDKKVTKG